MPKEYCIYRINNGGTPFVVDYYHNPISAELRVRELVNEWERKGLHYYIDNDFFENKFSSNEKHLFYCCIKVRDVGYWGNYYSNDLNKSNSHNCKIISFFR